MVLKQDGSKRTINASHRGLESERGCLRQIRRPQSHFALRATKSVLNLTAAFSKPRDKERERERDRLFATKSVLRSTIGFVTKRDHKLVPKLRTRLHVDILFSNLRLMHREMQTAG